MSGDQKEPSVSTPPAALNEPSGTPAFGESNKGKLKPSTEEALDEVVFRLTTGRVLFVTSIIGVVALLVYTSHTLGSSYQLPTSCTPKEFNGPACTVAQRFEFTHLGAHAILMAAAFYFLYQLLRAGERMLIPAFWHDRPAFVALMLGIKSPLETVDALLGQLEKAARIIPSGRPKE